ncbi:MAG TPA: hypothetical protein ENH82_13240 [bacterium]|nr:hypothetical protein [bacterium]
MNVTLKFKSTIVRTFVIVIIYILSKDVLSQEIEASRINSSINIDGVLNEKEWDGVEFITDFIQFEPVYGSPSSYETIVKVLYDDRMIYFGIDCKDPEPDKITAKTTKRDGAFMNDDATVILLDTYNDKSNAYYFGVNPIGTQQDGKLADNGRTDDLRWDGSWESACTINQDGWACEIAIPFETIKFNAKNTVWGFNVERRIARKVERSFWIGNLTDPNRVSQFGRITNLDLRRLTVKKYTIIPYSQFQFQKNEKTEKKFGVDMRYSLSRNLGIEATVNPDFATIESDVEQVNLTRFELFYPEKRPYFLEGAENYSTRVQQFYSRRIGEIPWGTKITGKIKNWNINALSTQSAPSSAGAEVESGEDAIYSVFRIGREIKQGSNIGIIGANRTFLDKNSGSIGLVSTLFFTDVLGMTSQIIKSYGEADKGTWVYFFRPAYDSQFTHFHVRYSHYGNGVMENMNVIGFIRDDDRREFDTNIRRHFWINKFGIEEIYPMINYNQYWSQNGVLRSWVDTNKLTIKFLKKLEYSLNYTEEFKRYEKDFRNRLVTNELQFDNKSGKSVSFSFSKGRNYDRDLEKFTGGFDIKLLEGWDFEYNFARHWFKPADPDDNSWIHYVRTTYYVNKDLYFKLFYQTKHRFSQGTSDLEFDLLRKTLQLVFVWRIIPPFGSIQFAYQEGFTVYSNVDDQEKTLFSKLSWVF